MDEVLAAASRVAVPDLARAYAELPVGVVITEASGLVIFANNHAEALFTPLQPVSFGLRTLPGGAWATSTSAAAAT